MKALTTHVCKYCILCLCTMLFISCGDGDDTSKNSNNNTNENTISSNPEVIREETNSKLYGTWYGFCGSSFITKLVFGLNSKGYITMNSTTNPYAHNGLFTYRFDDDNGYIYMTFSDTQSTVIYKVRSLSSSKMTLLNDYDMEYSMTLTSTSTEVPTIYSNEASTNVEKINLISITWDKTMNVFTKDYYHYYKKTLDSGDIELYTDAACLKLIGKAIINTMTKFGEYDVSSYTYLVKNLSNSRAPKYYFFN